MKVFSNFAAVTALTLAATTVQAADKVTLQLKWVTQAQFAGYYVAAEKGFYEEEDLEVEIKAGGPDISPPQVIAGGGRRCRAGLDALSARQPRKGIGAGEHRAALQVIGHDAHLPQRTPASPRPKTFRGKTLGVWFFGNEYPFLSWMSQLGIPTEGGEDGVTVLKQGFNVDPILQKQADCVSTMTYNEYWQIIDAGLTPDDLVVFKYEDQGVSTLEDGIYVMEENLDDPAFVDKMVRFVRASMKGWKYAEENVEEAAEIVLDNDETGAQTEKHQVRMMGEIAKLTAGSDGKLDPADYERTVETLMKGGSDPVITKAPEGAWTHAVTDKAL